MIKKLLFTTALVISGIIMVNAQCTPDLTCAALVCPDTITNLPHAQATFLYTTTLTVKVPADTNYPPFGVVTVDTLKYLSISGLPAGFTASPDNSAGWPGPSYGCLLITGITTNAQAGTHPLVISVSVKAMSGAITMPLSLTGYKIIVDSTNGISIINSTKFTLEQNNPNPFNSSTTISFTSSNSDVYNFSVTNIIGEVVYNQTVNAVSGINKIEFSAANLPSGIYMYKLGNKSEVYARRMIISGK